MRPHSKPAAELLPDAGGPAPVLVSSPCIEAGATWLPENHYEVIRRQHLRYLERRAVGEPMTREDILFSWSFGDLLKLSCETELDQQEARDNQDWVR